MRLQFAVFTVFMTLVTVTYIYVMLHSEELYQLVTAGLR